MKTATIPPIRIDIGAGAAERHLHEAHQNAKRNKPLIENALIFRPLFGKRTDAALSDGHEHRRGQKMEQNLPGSSHHLELNQVNFSQYSK